MRFWAAAAPALILLGLGGCAVPRRSAPTATVTELAAAIAADSARSDRETDAKIRAGLAADAIASADACLAREPRSAACLYGHALALGLDARAHPTRAGETLQAMLANLQDAEQVDALYDDAGPARVRALVLLRAPGWPLGPGDPEAGLAAARRAASLRPDYPPNALALAEALVRSGDSNGARGAYAAARTRAAAAPESPERADWLRQADEGLRRLPEPAR